MLESAGPSKGSLLSVTVGKTTSIQIGLESITLKKLHSFLVAAEAACSIGDFPVVAVEARLTAVPGLATAAVPAALAAAELEAEIRAAELAAAELSEAKLAAQQEAVEEIAEPEPVRASDFATGSFDIIESAEQAATEEFDDENFDVLLADGELGFAREPKSDAKSKAISTIERRAKPFSQLFVWSSLTVGIAPILLAYLSLNFDLTAIDRIAAIAVGFGISALLISVVAIGGKRSGLSTLFLSRAAFGVTANIVPAIAQVIAKIAIGSVLVVGLLGMFNGNVVGLPEFGQVAITTSGLEISWMAVLVAVLLVLGSVLALLGGKVLY